MVAPTTAANWAGRSRSRAGPVAAALRDGLAQGREYVIGSIPFADLGDPVHSVDNLLRPLSDSPVTTMTSGDRSLLYRPEEGRSELYHLASDPR